MGIELSPKIGKKDSTETIISKIDFLLGLSETIKNKSRLLNLAITGDTFGEVNLSAEENNVRSKLDLLTERLSDALDKIEKLENELAN